MCSNPISDIDRRAQNVLRSFVRRFQESFEVFKRRVNRPRYEEYAVPYYGPDINQARPPPNGLFDLTARGHQRVNHVNQWIASLPSTLFTQNVILQKMFNAIGLAAMIFTSTRIIVHAQIVLRE